MPDPAPAQASQQSATVLEIGDPGLSVNLGMRVQFEVSKSLEKEPNAGKITITNLSQHTRESLQRKDMKIRFEAGYAASGVTTLFQGSIRTVDHLRQGADWQTILNLGDGERAFRWSRASESFAAGTTAEKILKYLAGALGMQLAHVPVGVTLGQSFDQGYVCHGAAQAEMDRLVKSIGATWSIQDGAIQVMGRDESLTIAIPLLSPETGLIDSPEMGSAEKKGKPALVKCKALLFPAKPGGLVDLRSERYRGKLKIVKCAHAGDTHGADWYTTFEGQIKP